MIYLIFLFLLWFVFNNSVLFDLLQKLQKIQTELKEIQEELNDDKKL